MNVIDKAMKLLETDQHTECFQVMAAEIERLQVALQTAHGALLCIGGTDSNWSEYARNVADEVAPALTE